LTSKLQSDVELLRVYLEQGDGSMKLKSGVMVDQWGGGGDAFCRSQPGQL